VALDAIKRKRNGDVAAGAELVLPDAAVRPDLSQSLQSSHPSHYHIFSKVVRKD
jgi:hypothetical protein